MSNSQSIRQFQKQAYQLYKKGEYFPKRNVYKWMPIISGCPKIETQKSRVFRGTAFFSRQPVLKIKKMPNYCHIRKLINYPYNKFGAPLISIVGNYGTGKSLLKNLLKAFMLARGVRILEFNDRRFEARNLACHGWFNKHGEFKPFEIVVMVPDGYVFKKENPLWNYYSNVKMKYWNHHEEIVNEMKPHKMVVVYEECFTDEAKLQLWIDLMEVLGENMNPNIVNMFSHHELARLIPENPTKEIYKTVRLASNVAMNLRKDRIGMITTFHIISEVFFRISQKFGYILMKRPVNRGSMTSVEKDAMSYGVKEVNVSRGGYWMKHEFGYFPELPDIFRLIPQREKITYPDFDIYTDAKDTKQQPNVLTDEELTLLLSRQNNLTWAEIGKRLGIPKGTAYSRYQKLIDRIENSEVVVDF